MAAPARSVCLVLLMASALPGTGSLAAQIRASERGSASQTIDGTVITVDYARPRVRGRAAVFGGEVKWKEVWTPGANWATTIEVNRPIQLDGHPVAVGKYSVWMVVDTGEWTLILDPRHRRFHTDRPDSTGEQIRYPIHPEPGPFTEVLTWSFPEVRSTGGALVMQWATTRVTLNLTVEPKHRLPVAAKDARPYLGRYRLRFSEAADTAKPSTITLAYEEGKLMAHWDPAPFPEIATFALFPISDDWFMAGTLENGQLYDVWSDLVFEFSRERPGGRVKGFEVRGEGDKLEATATRE